MGAEKVRAFAVWFTGAHIGNVEAATMAEAVGLLGLTPCAEYRGNWCSEKMEPHAHIPGRMFAAIPETRGGVEWYIAALPHLGPVAYPFDREHSEPAPVYFRETVVLHPTPAPAE